MEMLVSTAIFSMVMVVALGSLLSMSEADRRAQALNSAVNNLSAGLDSMTRAIRTGTSYHCGSGGPTTQADCGSPSGTMSFYDSQGHTVQYCLNDGIGGCTTSTTCSGSTCTILRSVDGGSNLALTSPEVRISNFGFFVKGSAIGALDNTQPRVVIFIRGSVTVKTGMQSYFNIQTTVTQRVYDQ